jgi:intein/homing endonuclease
MNEKEAELIGMHVGDGTLYLTGKTLVWELRGSINEKDFYEYVKSLIKKLFNLDVTPKYRGTNSYGIQTTNKIITDFFVNNGFKPGKKVYTVSIPENIKSTSNEVNLSFLRGLFDTDGCIRFEKNRTKYRYYPRIEFGFASKNLVMDLKELFDELGFRVYMWNRVRQDGVGYSIGLAGFNNLDRWVREVRPANSKHIKRIADGLSNKDKVNLKKISTNL